MFNGEIALVTGASRGIGRAIAELLKQRGARVAGTATTEAGATRIAEELGDGALGLKLDVRDSDSVDEVMAVIADQFGAAPGILVNNAGITRDNLLMRMKDAEWDDIIDTDLSSVYRLSKACLRPMMKARKGRIINISSVVALSGNASQTNYAAAKAGMIGFTKSLAREVGSRGITVNAVAPGYIATDMTNALPQAHRQAMVDTIPLGRPGEPAEIAAVVGFLASDDGGYITGETINVNGGMYMS